MFNYYTVKKKNMLQYWNPFLDISIIKFLFPNFFPVGQVFSQKLLSLRDQHKTAEGSPSDDDSYLGYSVATGEFNGDGDRADVIVGMPRGANLTGKVNIADHIIIMNPKYDGATATC